jgi:hypothetical protein
MGEVIVFKAEKDGTHLRPPPEGSAKIVFFTGVWHEPMNDIDVIPAQEFYLLGDPPFRFFGTEAVGHGDDDRCQLPWRLKVNRDFDCAE